MREFRDDTVIHLYLPYPHFKQFTYNEVNLECIWNLFQHKKSKWNWMKDSEFSRAQPSHRKLKWQNSSVIFKFLRDIKLEDVIFFWEFKISLEHAIRTILVRLVLRNIRVHSYKIPVAERQIERPILGVRASKIHGWRETKENKICTIKTSSQVLTSW